MTDTCDGHVFIQINIFEYSPAPFCQLAGTIRSLCRANGLYSCIHIQKMFIKWKVYLSEYFEQRNTDKGWHLKIPFM
jgi:hypothetical protein